VQRGKVALGVCLVLAVAGCATERPGGVSEYYSGNRQAARATFEENLKAEPNSRALYYLRLGTLELDSGNLEAAREDFIEATGVMQDFKADGEFKAVVGSESTKEYKGDPYEQMMALWYLGLLDYMFGEYDKALPDFKSAALADGGTKDERYRSDAASVFIMMAKTYQAAGDGGKAAEEYREAGGVYTFREAVDRMFAALDAAKGDVVASAKEPEAAEAAYEFLADGVSAGATQEQDPAAALGAASDFAFDELEKASKSRSEKERLRGQDPNVISGYIKEIASAAGTRLSGGGGSVSQSPLAGAIKNVSDPGNNILVVVGLGRGPFKYRTGEFGELAKIGQSQYSERGADVYVDGREAGRAQMVDDIYYQASTRGGRAMDSILGGKAVFKGVTGVLSAVALANAAASHSAKRRNESLVAGVVLGAMSLATRPEADIRSWETLPDRILMLATRSEPGTHNIEVRFEGGGVQKFENVEVKKGEETVIYVRSGGGGAWAVSARRQL
jgi:tetratricopeptide (TPR) repeat protein